MSRLFIKKLSSKIDNINIRESVSCHSYMSSSGFINFFLSVYLEYGRNTLCNIYNKVHICNHKFSKWLMWEDKTGSLIFYYIKNLDFSLGKHIFHPARTSSCFYETFWCRHLRSTFTLILLRATQKHLINATTFDLLNRLQNEQKHTDCVDTMGYRELVPAVYASYDYT